MNKRLWILTIGILLIAFSLATADVDVSTLHLKRINGETVLKIDVTGPFQFTHQVVAANDGKPNRVIVDIFPAVHKLGKWNFTTLPASVISAIRTSQFAVKPENVVRVVLDMQAKATYRIEKSGDCAFVFISDTATADFPEWASSGTPDAATPDVAPVATAETQLAQTPAATPEVQKSTESPQPQSPALVVQEPEVVVVAEPAVPDVAASTQRMKSGLIEKELSEASRATSPGPTVSAPSPVQTPSEPEPAITVAENQSSSGPTVATTSHETPTAVASSEKSEAPTVTVTAPTEPLAGSENLNENAAVTAGTDIIPTIGDTSVTSDSSLTASTARFRRDPAFPTRLKGTIVAEFPQRMLIEYAPGVFRDPFESLISDTKLSGEPYLNRIPDVETSRLVGILESREGHNRALLEDLDGYGYIVKQGDKVKKGYVEKIESTKAFFQLFEYGWSRTIALYLGHN